MKKFRTLLISYGISSIFGIICYFFSKHMIISISVSILMFLLLKYYLLIKINKNNEYRKSLINFSHFANSLIMQITITPNATTAINEISNFLDESQRDVLQNDELLVKEKFESIKKYYDFALYDVFEEIIVLYDTQGGNIIDMSLQLLDQIDDYIKNHEEIHLDNNKKISEILILWAFAFGILFYIRSIMYDYYLQILQNQSFQLIIGGFFIMFILTLLIISKKYIEIKIG